MISIFVPPRSMPMRFKNQPHDSVGRLERLQLTARLHLDRAAVRLTG